MFEPPPHVEVEDKVNLRPTVTRPVSLAVGLPFGVHEQIFCFLCDICNFLDVRHPLWREAGSVITHSVTSGPCQSNHSRGPRPSELMTIFYLQTFITVGHLRSSRCGTPSLRRGRVCNLLVQFALTLWSKSRRTHDHILISHLRLLGSLFVASSDSQGYRWRYSNPPPHGPEECNNYNSIMVTSNAGIAF
jgi:hypothetical protein